MSQWNFESSEGGEWEEEDTKNDETFGAAVEPPSDSLPAFFGGEDSGAALGGGANDYEALKSAEEQGLGDTSDSLQDDPNANMFNDDTFGESLENIPTEGLPGFFGGDQESNTKDQATSGGGSGKKKEADNDDSEWKKKQEVFAKFHEEFLREQEVSGITSKEDLSTDEQLASLLNFSIDDDDELLQTAIGASAKDYAYSQRKAEASAATETAKPPEAEMARPPQTYADLAKSGVQEPPPPPAGPSGTPSMATATPQVNNNVEFLRHQIMQFQLLLTSPPPLAPGLEGCPSTPEEYRRLIYQRQEACQKLQQLYMSMQQLDNANKQQGYNVPSISRQLAFLTSGPHAAVASPPIQAEYIKLFQTGSWRLPKKSHGRFMTSQETRLIASMQGRQLYIAGAYNPGANWYLHMWRARKLQEIAKSYGFEGIPEDIVLPKGSVEYLDDTNDRTKLSMEWGKWTKSRIWESFHHVLGRSEKGNFRKPKRLLNLGDEPDLPEVSTKAIQESDSSMGRRTDQEYYEERRKEAARKEAQTKAAAKMLAGKLTDQSPDKQSLWSARAAISNGLDALVRVRDAANSRSIRLKSSPPPTHQETELMQKQIRDSLSRLVRALGLETNFEFGMDSPSEVKPCSLRELSTPSQDGLAILMVTISMSKGKKLLCRAVPWLPPGPVAALITAAMEHLPHFVASAAEGPDAEEADGLLSESLAKWISTAVVPQTTDSQDSHTSLDLLIIWIRHLTDCHDASILQALLNHPGGAKVFIALLERGKDEANSLQGYAQQGNLEPRKKSQFESSVREWNTLTDKLASMTQ